MREKDNDGEIEKGRKEISDGYFLWGNLFRRVGV